jgi:DNA-binding beta-propeller fold protein YncE
MWLQGPFLKVVFTLRCSNLDVMTKRSLALTFGFWIGASCILNAQDPPPLRVVRSITLPAGVKGSFDHLAVDLAHNRLFVTPEDYHAVLVVDLNAGAVVHEIDGIARPHAILYRADLNKVFVTDGVDGSVKIFDGTTYRLLQTTKLLKDADSIGYDASRRLLYVDNGGKDEGQSYSVLSVVDTTSGRKTADIHIEGEALEAMAPDVFRPRLYLNNKAKSRIEAIDTWKNEAVAAWPVTLGKGNVAMGLDEPHQRLFVGCRSGQLVVFDTNTGRELQALPITSGVDDVVYDAGTKRIYAAGAGVVSVFDQIDADHYRALASVPSAPGGKTALLVPSLNRYYVAAPAHDSQGASVVEMEPMGVAPYKSAEPTPALTLDAPAAERLLLSTMSRHPYLRKMGLHAVPAHQKDSVIVANANASRIGVKSSAGDLDAVKEGATYCVKRDDGSFYNVKMPMFDASNRRIGILVMELPYTSATDQADAVRQAEQLRAELAHQIPSLSALFQYSLDVSAPRAQKLADETMAAHPELQKMGIHVVPGTSAASVIVASNYASKIGKPSSEADMSVAHSGKPTVHKVTEGNPFYDLALPLHDAGGKPIGVIVMELRATAAKDENAALQQATGIVSALEKKIPGKDALFVGE